jgi:hypothetical protein
MEFIVGEIHENRAEIKEVQKLLGGKVGRAELFGWLGATATLIGVALRFVV